jgi:hypothetical protein
MPRGYPDFFGMSIFSKYGVLVRAPFGLADADAVAHTVLTVTGKGIISSGYLTVSGPTNPTGLTVLLNVDSGQLTSGLFNNNFGFKGWLMNSLSLAVVQYNTIDGVYSMAIRPGITYDTGFSLIVQNATGGNSSWSGEVCYQSIQ